MRGFLGAVLVIFSLCNAQAAPALKKDEPIEIAADVLDVHQDEHKAIFSGNVIATQGTTTLRSQTMTAYYNESSEKTAPTTPPAKPAPADSTQGISRIVATGSVVFTTPTEIANSDNATYDANTETITLTGASVTLTRDKNVLKGQNLVYNMKTGQSVLTSGSGVQVDGVTVGKPGRVHGLFVPKSDKAN